MKKIFLFLFCGVMLVALTACGNEEQFNDISSESGNSSTQGSSSDTKVTPDTWGVMEQYEVMDDEDDNETSYNVNVPRYSGPNIGRGIMTQQADGTMTLVSGQRSYSPKNISISEVFPAYEKQVEYTLVSAYGLLSENFIFTYGFKIYPQGWAVRTPWQRAHAALDRVGWASQRLPHPAAAA